MIHHASLPALEPEHAARTLAKILGGEAMRFPVITGAWIAWSGDGVTELEIVPANQAYTRNAVAGREPAMVSVDGRGPAGWHVAIGTQVRADEVVRIARDAGWPAEICDRAGYFSLVEIWLDDQVLVEVLDPEMAARYSRTFTADRWKAMLSEVASDSHGTDLIEQLRMR
jgi:hypothetical protein